MAYASALSRNPEATYRQIDVAGRTATADGPALVELLYAELIAALRAAAWAAENRRYAVKSERVTRATAILFALDAGLDFEQGGDVAQSMATLYAGARRTVLTAAIGDDPVPFRRTADDFDEIAKAWASVRAA